MEQHNSNKDSTYGGEHAFKATWECQGHPGSVQGVFQDRKEVLEYVENMTDGTYTNLKIQRIN